MMILSMSFPSIITSSYSITTPLNSYKDDEKKVMRNLIEEMTSFKKGDIVFFHDSRFDESIWNFFYWTHCIMYDESDLCIWACEIVKKDNLSTILSYFEISNWAQLRLNQNINMTPVIQFAERQLGKPFDMLSLFFITKQINPSPYHPGYGYYCTELVWASYLGGIDINIDPNNVGWITPLEIYHNNIFKKIYIEDPSDVPTATTTAWAITRLFNVMFRQDISLCMIN